MEVSVGHGVFAMKKWSVREETVRTWQVAAGCRGRRRQGLLHLNVWILWLCAFIWSPARWKSAWTDAGKLTEHFGTKYGWIEDDCGKNCRLKLGPLGCPFRLEWQTSLNHYRPSGHPTRPSFRRQFFLQSSSIHPKSLDPPIFGTKMFSLLSSVSSGRLSLSRTPNESPKPQNPYIQVVAD